MKKIFVISSGFFPVPATKGGAVETIINNLMKINEDFQKANFNIISVYDQKAYEESKQYKSSNIIFVKIPMIIRIFDLFVFWIAKNVLQKKNAHSYRYIFQRLYFLNQASKNLHSNEYDKVILENHPSQYLALKWRKNYLKYEGKYYYHCHNEFPSKYRCDKEIEKTVKFLCVSNFIAESLQKKLNILSNRTIVLRNEVDNRIFRKNVSEEELGNLRKQYNIPINSKIILFTGRIVPEKGIREVLMSLKKIHNCSYILLIVGSSLNATNTKTNYQLEIENLIKENNNVRFTGYIQNDEIYKFYKLADLALLPSVWNDPAPLTVIEALVSGLPVVSTISGGIPEYAIDGSAILVKRNGEMIETLSNIISNLLNSESELKKMSTRALEITKSNSIENYYNNFIKMIE